MKTNTQLVLYKAASSPRLRRVMRKQAEGSFFDSAKTWLSDPENLKNLGVGAGLGLGTYALTGLIPGMRKNKALRLLLGLGIGGAGGYFGRDIRNKIYEWSGEKARKEKRDQLNAAEREREADVERSLQQNTFENEQLNQEEEYEAFWNDRYAKLRAYAEHMKAQDTELRKDRAEREAMEARQADATANRLTALEAEDAERERSYVAERQQREAMERQQRAANEARLAELAKDDAAREQAYIADSKRPQIPARANDDYRAYLMNMPDSELGPRQLARKQQLIRDQKIYELRMAEAEERRTRPRVTTRPFGEATVGVPEVADEAVDIINNNVVQPVARAGKKIVGAVGTALTPLFVDGGERKAIEDQTKKLVSKQEQARRRAQQEDIARRKAELGL